MILNGTLLAQKITDEIAKEIKRRKLTPHLAILHIGDDEASKIYMQAKQKACREVGITCTIHTFEKKHDIIACIQKLNHDKDVNGIIVQLPLPSSIDPYEIIAHIDPHKDVDGLTPTNIGRLAQKRSGIIPATPRGIIALIESVEPIKNKDVTIIGRSMLVGTPLSLLLTQKNATVTLCHSHTRDLKEHTIKADIIISAAGIPQLVTADMIKENVIVIDVGITRVENKLIGDVDFESIKDKAKAITPVPKGVGPMTVAMLLKNTIETL